MLTPLFLFFFFFSVAETLKVRKSSFEKFKTWLSGIEVLTKGKDKKQLGELDQEYNYKKGFLVYASGISVSLLPLFAVAEPQKPTEKPNSGSQEASEQQRGEEKQDEDDEDEDDE
jgi:hypothetical protein